MLFFSWLVYGDAWLVYHQGKIWIQSAESYTPDKPRLSVLDIATGVLRDLTPPKSYSVDFRWSRIIHDRYIIMARWYNNEVILYDMKEEHWIYTGIVLPSDEMVHIDVVGDLMYGWESNDYDEQNRIFTLDISSLPNYAPDALVYVKVGSEWKVADQTFRKDIMNDWKLGDEIYVCDEQSDWKGGKT